METDYVCNICNKKFTSRSNVFVHKREKHTFNNTILTKCNGCLKDFYSILFNKNLNKKYEKCEECRDLQKTLATNDLLHNTFVYNNNKERFFIEYGKAIKVCSVYTCNFKNCTEHMESNIVQCIGSKCNKCYIKNGLNQCNDCIERGYKSKNKTRCKVKLFKQELGGKCVDCGFNELFFLEFDHIDPTKKTIQITRSSPEKWNDEKNNLELRCGRCHRIKTAIDRDFTNENYKMDKSKKYKLDKKNFAHNIKKIIGCCQICKWTYQDKDKMCYALDFDHIEGEKFKQISSMYYTNKETITNEILKTRLVCRHCHELHTCLQRGGKKLKIYYSDEEIEKFKSVLNNSEMNEQYLLEIKNAIF